MSNRGPYDITSITTALEFTPPILWIQVVSTGSGGLVVVDDSGVTRTYANLTATTPPLVGPFRQIVSMTCSKIRIGDSVPVPPPPIVSTVLGSTDAGEGSALIGSADAGGFTAQTTVEAQLQELYQNLFSATGGSIAIPLSAWREVDANGDVGNITANGGVLASDTTPVFEAVATSNEHRILWATGNADPIGVSVMLPDDFDDTADAFVKVVVSSGSTNAASLVLASAWSAGAAGTEVSDSADDSSAKSATPHTLTITIDKGDVPTGARRATLRLTPPTHATDTISLYATAIAYKRKLLTS